LIERSSIITIALAGFALPTACIALPGTEGQPCSSKNVCATGLACLSGVCQSKTIVTWELVPNSSATAGTVQCLHGYHDGTAERIYAVDDEGKILRYEATNDRWLAEEASNSPFGCLFVDAKGPTGPEVFVVGKNAVGRYPVNASDFTLGSLVVDTVKDGQGQAVTLGSAGYSFQAYHVAGAYGESSQVRLYAAGDGSCPTKSYDLLVYQRAVGNYWTLIDGADLQIGAQGVWASDKLLAVVGTSSLNNQAAIFDLATQGSAELGNTTKWNLTSTVGLRAVWGTPSSGSPSYLVAVGDPGKLFEVLDPSVNRTWTVGQAGDLNPSSTNHRIDGVGPEEFYVAGNGIYKCGKSVGCTKHELPWPEGTYTQALEAVWVGTNYVWAAGASGTFFRFRRN
jgi:hypothetical protein